MFMGTGMRSPIPIKIGPILDRRLAPADREELVGHLREFMSDRSEMHLGAGGCQILHLTNRQRVVYEFTQDDRIFMLRGDTDAG